MDATRYWSRFPGNFVNTQTGQYVKDLLAPGMDGPKFTGSPREWYETLVLVIQDCVTDLQNATFAKYGRAKRLEIDVYASADVCCLFECSVLLKLPPRQGPKPKDGKSRHVGTITFFDIWEDQVMANDTIRVCALFDTDDGVEKAMYGNVKILDMPEFGRKP